MPASATTVEVAGAAGRHHFPERRQAGSDLRKIGRTVCGQCEVAAPEQRDAQVRFELPDAVTHGIAQPGGGLEGQKTLDRGIC